MELHQHHVIKTFGIKQLLELYFNFLIKLYKMKTIFSILFLVILFFSACKPAVIASKPVYVEVARPLSPSSNHIWVDGDWIWNRRTRSYTYKNGYWMMPNNGNTHIAGYWKTTRRGHYWVPGRWR
jgi:hypothetical protein